MHDHALDLPQIEPALLCFQTYFLEEAKNLHDRASFFESELSFGRFRQLRACLVTRGFLNAHVGVGKACV